MILTGTEIALPIVQALIAAKRITAGKLQEQLKAMPASIESADLGTKMLLTIEISGLQAVTQALVYEIEALEEFTATMKSNQEKQEKTEIDDGSGKAT